jgi:hypothetical protein
MKGLTSKEHLFLRVLSVVTVIDAVTFYVASRNLQTFISNFSETVTLITVLTLFVLTIHLEFWWRYQRRTDNKRWLNWRTVNGHRSWNWSSDGDTVEE